MGVMEVLIALVTITLPIMATVLLGNWQTQRLLREIKETQEGIRRCLVKLERLQRQMYRDHTCLLRKLNVGMHANALMHGWSCAEGLTPEQIRKLPEPKVYDLELGICYYKP